MKEGTLEGILVFTIPTVFLGLGYIIHMVQKGKGIKNMIRVAALIVLTFLFDGLLAYQIEKKIYEFNKTPDSQAYNLKVALGEAVLLFDIFFKPRRISDDAGLKSALIRSTGCAV